MSRYRFVSAMKAEGFPVQAVCCSLPGVRVLQLLRFICRRDLDLAMEVVLRLVRENPTWGLCAPETPSSTLTRTFLRRTSPHDFEVRVTAARVG